MLNENEPSTACRGRPSPLVQDDSTLWNGSVGSANLDLLLDPVRAPSGQPAALQPVAGGPVRVGAEEAEVRIVRGQDKTNVRDSGQLLREFSKCMEGQCFGGQVDLMA